MNKIQLFSRTNRNDINLMVKFPFRGIKIVTISDNLFICFRPVYNKFSWLTSLSFLYHIFSKFALNFLSMQNSFYYYVIRTSYRIFFIKSNTHITTLSCLGLLFYPAFKIPTHLKHKLNHAVQILWSLNRSFNNF